MEKTERRERRRERRTRGQVANGDTAPDVALNWEASSWLAGIIVCLWCIFLDWPDGWARAVALALPPACGGHRGGTELPLGLCGHQAVVPSGLLGAILPPGFGLFWAVWADYDFQDGQMWDVIVCVIGAAAIFVPGVHRPQELRAVEVRGTDLVCRRGTRRHPLLRRRRREAARCLARYIDAYRLSSDRAGQTLAVSPPAGKQLLCHRVGVGTARGAGRDQRFAELSRPRTGRHAPLRPRV